MEPAPSAPSVTPTAILPTNTPTPQPTPTPRLAADPQLLARSSEDSIRVMSYNVNWDSIFQSLDPLNHELRRYSRVVAFRRILQALQPDLLCLQEINPERPAEQVSEIIEEALGGEWTALIVRDTVIATRYALRTDGYSLSIPSVIPNLPQAAALIDLPDAEFGDEDLYLVCAHFTSGGNYADVLMRQRQADVIAAHLGDARTLGGAIGLAAGTGMLVLGDFNIFESDPAAHYDTLLSGDIDNEERFGPDVFPDWDDSSLANAEPSHNGLGELDYTWRNDNEPFPPGALDRILYTDSVLRLEKTFVLNTMLMAPELLAAYGLEADDVLLDPISGYYDHLPLVADFAIIP
jgi:endonuclease/exonuclease/phosphatase family metal-dependent hydrolase